MRVLGLVGVCAARKRRRRPAPAVHDDLVQRRFVADAPDRLWCTDITEHSTSEGRIYCAAVLDVYSRRIVGWSIADHMRSELVVDALQMARWNRQPQPGTIVHADRGAQRGFNRSSQHLDLGGVLRWRNRRQDAGSGLLTGRCARRCGLRAGRRLGSRLSGSSGG